MLGWQKRIDEKQKQIHKLQKEIQQQQVQGRRLTAHGNTQVQQLESHYASKRSSLKLKISDYLKLCPPQSVAPWDAALWATWDPVKTREEEIIRVGEIVDQRDSSLYIPTYIPFTGQRRTVIIRSDQATYTQGLALLQSLVMRTAMMLPHQSFYSLFDPAGAGSAFPMLRHLPTVRPRDNEIYRDLDQVRQDIRRIIETYLDAQLTSFEIIPPEIRINERFQFVFAADFPNQYERRAIEALQSISATGTQAGVYLFVHNNISYDLPRDISMEGFKNSFVIDLAQPSTMSIPTGFYFRPDTAPSAHLQVELGEALQRAKPPERLLDWDKTVGIPEADWWHERPDELITTPIGARGGNERLDVWFGMKDERPCTHGMLGAMTGSGKSNLYHTLICGLATRYSPLELRFYLVDGKNGVEFEPYRHLPHAEVISLKSPAELSRSVLAGLVAEKDRRDGVFKRVGVRDFTEYRKQKQMAGNLPRILLLVDEYQQLFEGDRDGIASNYLRQLAEKGRSAGIHMLLSSQRFGAAGMLNQTYIFGNTHLRMAMKMTESDIQGLTEFGRRGKALIATCDLPGKIVINDSAGDDGINYAGKTAFLQKERREELLRLLEKKAQSLPTDALPQRVIFDGEAQPALLDNSEFTLLLSSPTWLTAQELESIARKLQPQGGFDLPDWFPSEHPRIAWLGQEFKIRKYARIVFQRSSAENAILVGGSNAARYGMLTSLLTSLSINLGPDDTQFTIINRCIPNTQWSTILSTVHSDILRPADYVSGYTTTNNDAEFMLEALHKQFEQRLTMPEARLLKQPEVFVVIADANRIDKLRRKADPYDLSNTPLGEKFQRLLTEGSTAGIHIILSFSDVGTMNSVLGMGRRVGLINFRHRVALQMSEDDAFTFMSSRKPSQLQVEGDTPICGLYKDMQNDRDIRFKPYSTDSGSSAPGDDLTEQLKNIGKQLRRKK